MKGLFLIALLGLAVTAQANTLYKCTDSGGHTTYTNTRSPAMSCTVLSREAPTASREAAPARPRSAASSPAPADFPKVSLNTQQQRDNDRRHILEQERTAELRHLDEARRTLAEQEARHAPSEQLRPHRDRIALHERNLEALRREMSNLK